MPLAEPRLALAWLLAQRDDPSDRPAREAAVLAAAVALPGKYRTLAGTRFRLARAHADGPDARAAHERAVLARGATAWDWFFLAALALRGDDTAGAAAFTDRAFALLPAEQERDEADLPDALRTLAAMYEAWGWYDRALVLRTAHVAAERRRRPAEAPELGSALVDLGWVLLLLDRPAEAEPLLREGLTIRERHPPDDSRIAGTRVLLGSALVALGRYAEAEPLLREGHDGLVPKRPILGVHAFRLPLAGFRLAQLCEASGRPDEARRWWEALGRDYGLEHLLPPGEGAP